MGQQVPGVNNNTGAASIRVQSRACKWAGDDGKITHISCTSLIKMNIAPEGWCDWKMHHGCIVSDSTVWVMIRLFARPARCGPTLPPAYPYLVYGRAQLESCFLVMPDVQLGLGSERKTT